MTITIEPLNYQNKRETLQAARAMHASFRKFYSNKKQIHLLIPLAERVKRIQHWEEMEKHGTGRTIVAKINGRIVGCGFGSLRSQHSFYGSVKEKIGAGKHYFLELMAVHPRFQRRGIGKALVDARIEHARQLGCIDVWVSTASNNEVQLANFKKMGFKEAHRDETKNKAAVYFVKKLS